MHWGTVMPDRLPAPARTLATRVGIAGNPGAERDRRNRTFVIDFAGGDLLMLDAAAPVRPVITHSRGKIARPAAHYSAPTGNWRVPFDLLPADADVVDLRLFLYPRGAPRSVPLSYQWHADDT